MASNEPPLDILTTYQLALQNDPTIEEDRADLQASLEKVPEARSQLLPILTANSQMQHTSGPVTYIGTPSTDRPFNTVDWSVQLTVPIFRPEGIFGLRESHAEADQARWTFRNAEQNALLRASKAYLDVLVAQSAVEAANAQAEALQAQEETAEHRFQGGAASVTDADESTARRQLSLSQLLDAQNDLINKRAELRQLIGAAPATLAGLKADVQVLLPEPAEMEDWERQAQENNPVILADQSAVRAASLETDKARAQRLPTVDGIASYGRDFTSGNANYPLDFGTNAYLTEGGIQVTWTLMDGGAIHAQISAAAAQRRKAEAELREAQQAAESDVENAYHGLINGISQIRALESAMAASERAVVGNQAGYKLGLRIDSDVLDSEQERYAAESNLEKVKCATIYDGLLLKAAAGELQPADLIGVNRMLAEP
jgi:outer membrane protein